MWDFGPKSATGRGLDRAGPWRQALRTHSTLAGPLQERLSKIPTERFVFFRRKFSAGRLLDFDTDGSGGSAMRLFRNHRVQPKQQLRKQSIRPYSCPQLLSAFGSSIGSSMAPTPLRSPNLLAACAQLCSPSSASLTNTPYAALAFSQCPTLCASVCRHAWMSTTSSRIMGTDASACLRYCRRYCTWTMPAESMGSSVLAGNRSPASHGSPAYIGSTLLMSLETQMACALAWVKPGVWIQSGSGWRNMCSQFRGVWRRISAEWYQRKQWRLLVKGC
ncbi:hypothetical protein DFJ74DRAFT_671556 [Hyaloraphidium curvatum]|nr:hypothetical protein DFJ74DRAFT_671556 [Hyaloraphidium curvatum]